MLTRADMEELITLALRPGALTNGEFQNVKRIANDYAQQCGAEDEAKEEAARQAAAEASKAKPPPAPYDAPEEPPKAENMAHGARWTQRPHNSLAEAGNAPHGPNSHPSQADPPMVS